jgi:hypothetical protein
VLVATLEDEVVDDEVREVGIGNARTGTREPVGNMPLTGVEGFVTGVETLGEGAVEFGGVREGTKGIGELGEEVETGEDELGDREEGDNSLFEPEPEVRGLVLVLLWMLALACRC